MRHINFVQGESIRLMRPRDREAERVYLDRIYYGLADPLSHRRFRPKGMQVSVPEWSAQ